MTPGSARLIVRVQPGAARSRVVRFEDGALHLRVAAPPVKGKANRELVDFLSRLLDLPRSAITIDKGLTSRRKTLAVTGLNPEALEARLANL